MAENCFEFELGFKQSYTCKYLAKLVVNKLYVEGLLTTSSGQRQKNPVGVSALPIGKFLRLQKVFAQVQKKIAPKQVKT